jgi:hypothetical protein
MSMDRLGLEYGLERVFEGMTSAEQLWEYVYDNRMVLMDEALLFARSRQWHTTLDIEVDVEVESLEHAKALVLGQRHDILNEALTGSIQHQQHAAMALLMYYDIVQDTLPLLHYVQRHTDLVIQWIAIHHIRVSNKCIDFVKRGITGMNCVSNKAIASCAQYYLICSEQNDWIDQILLHAIKHCENKLIAQILLRLYFVHPDQNFSAGIFEEVKRFPGYLTCDAFSDISLLIESNFTTLKVDRILARFLRAYDCFHNSSNRFETKLKMIELCIRMIEQLRSPQVSLKCFQIIQLLVNDFKFSIEVLKHSWYVYWCIEAHFSSEESIRKVSKSLLETLVQHILELDGLSQSILIQRIWKACIESANAIHIGSSNLCSYEDCISISVSILLILCKHTIFIETCLGIVKDEISNNGTIISDRFSHTVFNEISLVLKLK